MPKNMKNQGRKTLPKEYNNFPVTDPPKMKIYELPDKEFKMIVLKKAHQAIREHRKFNEIKKKKQTMNKTSATKKYQ